MAPEWVRDPAFAETLRRWRPELITVVAYGRILPRSVLDLPRHGCVNVHYSLLPKYRGAAPMAWTLVHGEEKTGVTIIRLVEKMDAGPILARAEVSVSPQDTAASLESRLVPLGAQLLRETIEKLKTGTIREISQNEGAASLAPLLKKEDGRIDWNQPASAIERRFP